MSPIRTQFQQRERDLVAGRRGWESLDELDGDDLSLSNRADGDSDDNGGLVIPSTVVVTKTIVETATFQGKQTLVTFVSRSTGVTINTPQNTSVPSATGSGPNGGSRVPTLPTPTNSDNSEATQSSIPPPPPSSSSNQTSDGLAQATSSTRGDLLDTSPGPSKSKMVSAFVGAICGLLALLFLTWLFLYLKNKRKSRSSTHGFSFSTNIFRSRKKDPPSLYAFRSSTTAVVSSHSPSSPSQPASRNGHLSVVSGNEIPSISVMEPIDLKDDGIGGGSYEKQPGLP